MWRGSFVLNWSSDRPCYFWEFRAPPPVPVEMVPNMVKPRPGFQQRVTCPLGTRYRSALGLFGGLEAAFGKGDRIQAVGLWAGTLVMVGIVYLMGFVGFRVVKEAVERR